MKIKSILDFSTLVLLSMGLSIFISGCASRCGPKPTPGDTDPRVAEDTRSWSENLLSLEFLSFFCTKKY